MANDLFAIADSGSNSFNLILFYLEKYHIKIIDRLPERIQLASVLNKRNVLSCRAMQRDWQELEVFAPFLQTSSLT